MLLDPILGLITNRELVWEMAWRDAKELNKGSALGNSWLVLRPLIQTAAYVVIVSFVFQSRLGPDSGPMDYSIFVLCGMVPWQLLTQGFVMAPALVWNHVELVKQTVYPIETLPLRRLSVASFGSLVSFVVYLILAAWSGMLSWTVVLVPLPLLLLLMLILGVSWILMVAGVVLQDFREIIGVAMNLLIFVSPVIVSESMVGAQVWRYILYNPLSHAVICFRDVCEGQWHPGSWAINIALSTLALLVGAALLSRAKPRINDYL